jgi:hypothetical protein
MIVWKTPCALLLSVFTASSAARASEGPRVPVALAWGPSGRLYVGARDGESLIAVEPGTWTVVGEWPLGMRPASMAAAEDGSSLLVGGMDGQLIVVRGDGRVTRRFDVGRGPTRVRTLPGGRAAVSCRWDEAVRIVDLEAGRILAEHPLRFAPGDMVGLPDGRIAVADAFGGTLAVFRPGEAGTESSGT